MRVSRFNAIRNRGRVARLSSRRGANSSGKQSKKVLTGRCLRFCLILALAAILFHIPLLFLLHERLSKQHKYLDIKGGITTITSSVESNLKNAIFSSTEVKKSDAAPLPESNLDLSPDTMIDPSTGLPIPAYVVSLIKCPETTNTRGFLDATLILRHSIHKQSRHDPNSSSRYSYKMYIIIHSRCSHHAPLFEKMGITPLIRDVPIEKNQIRNQVYKKAVASEMCCGSDEFIKLYAYEMMQHAFIVHLDMDVAMLHPMDELYDAMLYPSNSPQGREARSKLELEFPGFDIIPERIDAFITLDYCSSWPWKKIAGVQAGFYVVRPSLEAIEEYKSIILEGNYTPGFNNEAGWDGLGYGGWVGGKAMQGLMAYFYGHRHPNTAVELNICRYNQVAANVKWYQNRKPEFKGKCNRYPRHGNMENNTDCEDCRFTPVSKVKTVHYTACKKPWECVIQRTGKGPKPIERKRVDPGLANFPMCLDLHKEWFRLRHDLEDKMIEVMLRTNGNTDEFKTIQKKIEATRTGELFPDSYLGYCQKEGEYYPIVLPDNDKIIFDINDVYDMSSAIT